MTKVLVMIHPESSHFNACLGLLKAMETGGFELTMLASPADRDWCQKHAFHVWPYLQKSLAKDSKQARFFWQKRQQIKHAFKELTQDLQQAMNQVKPDLVLVDALTPYGAFAALGKGVPVCLLQTMLPMDYAKGLPPLQTPLKPARNEQEQQALENVWAGVLRKKKWEDLWAGHEQRYTNMARFFGVNPKIMQPKACFSFDLPLPKLVLCPQAFDFPRPTNPFNHYIGAHLQLDRDEVAFDFNWINPQKSLIYCATTTRRVTQDPRLISNYQTLLNSVANQEQYQLVLSTCGVEMAHLLKIPAAAKVVTYAPQLALLKRADLAIHHGGLNTIKECLHFGVRSLVFPGMDDQFGNAARIEYHRLGRMGRPDDIQAEVLAKRFQDLLSDAQMTQALAAMKPAFAARYQHQDVSAFLNDLGKQQRLLA